jgi:SWI/SNF-related matrix-associated actin-dependent regulator 1 of chromatin subfamily A
LFLDGLCETLDKNNTTYMRIDGKTSLEKRDQYVNDFQNGDVQVAVLSLLAASTGLTLTSCSTLLFGELYWVSGTILQAECRINRIGATETSDIRYIIANDTLDPHLFKMINYKQENVDRALDGAKFVEFQGLESM